MSGERFLILFNSQGSNVVDNSNLNSVLYNVNWAAFLPKKYKKFHCQFVFKSINYTVAALTLNGFLSLNLGKGNVYDGNTETKNIGFVYPVLQNSGGANSSFYSSTNNDNNDFYIDYPSNQQVLLSLKQFDNTSPLLSGAGTAGTPSKILHYVLYLSLEGIE